MSNGYYNHTTYPATNAAGSSASMRSELDAITSGFALLPTPLGSGQQGFSGGNWLSPIIQGQSGLGSIDAIPIGNTTPAAGSFTSLGASGTTTLASLVATTADINAGTIDATVIGATTRAAGSFTTLAANGAVTFGSGGALTGTFTGGTFSGALIQNTPVGSVTPSTGAFTTLGATGALTLSGGGSIAGTYTGAPTFSGNIVFSGVPNFSGAATALTAAAHTNTTQLSTTAFVETEFASPPTAGLGSVTPSPVAATTIVASGTITPAQVAGIVGTTTSNSAQAGSIGEEIENTSSGIALSSTVAGNIVGISLTAGDWDVTGGTEFQGTSNAAITFVASGVSIVSATLPASPLRATLAVTFPLNAEMTLALPTRRISLSSTTSVFIVAQINFSGGGAQALSYIMARRVR